MSGSLPPRQLLTPDNKGPAVVVVGYALVVTSIVLTAIRVVTAIVLKRAFSWDDVSIVASTILALVQTILAERAVDSGLGRHLAKLNAGDITSYYKFTYANQILAIVVMALAKISVLLLMLRLSMQKTGLRTACYAVGLAVIVWTVFSVIALAFQCGLPHPWVYVPERCAGRGAVWYPVVLFNIVTDLVIAALLVPALRKLCYYPVNLQWACCSGRGSCTSIPFHHSAVLFQAVCGRVLIKVRVCCAGIAQLALLPHALHASDQTWASVNLAIPVQVVMNLSIMTADIPSLNRFFAELQIGHGTRIHDPRYDLSNSSSRRQRYKLSNLSAKNRFAPVDGALLSNRIFAETRKRNGDGNGPGRKNKNTEGTDQGVEGSPSLTNEGGVMRSWEISYEVEDGNEAATHMSDHSRADLQP